MEVYSFLLKLVAIVVSIVVIVGMFAIVFVTRNMAPNNSASTHI